MHPREIGQKNFTIDIKNIKMPKLKHEANTITSAIKNQKPKVVNFENSKQIFVPILNLWYDCVSADWFTIIKYVSCFLNMRKIKM